MGRPNQVAIDKARKAAQQRNARRTAEKLEALKNKVYLPGEEIADAWNNASENGTPEEQAIAKAAYDASPEAQRFNMERWQRGENSGNNSFLGSLAENTGTFLSDPGMQPALMFGAAMGANALAGGGAGASGTAAGGDVLAGTGYAGGTALPAAGADLSAYGAGASGTAGAYGGGTAAAGAGTLAGVNAAASGGGAAAAGTGAAAAGTDWSDPGTYLPLVPNLLGIYGANEASDKQDALSREYMAMGEPYRGRLAELYNNPEAYLATQRGDIEKNVQRGTDIMSRSLSMGGNPVGSGNALQQLQSYASEGMDNQLYGRLNAERQNMANFGGLSQFNSAAPQAGQNAIDAGSKVYDAYGAAGSTLNDIFGTKKKSSYDKYLESITR